MRKTLYTRFWAYKMEEILRLISIYNQLQNNDSALLRHLSDRHVFLNLDFDEI